MTSYTADVDQVHSGVKKKKKQAKERFFSPKKKKKKALHITNSMLMHLNIKSELKNTLTLQCVDKRRYTSPFEAIQLDFTVRNY